MGQEGKIQVNNFVGGLVSDFHELNTPPNVTVDEDNCDLDRRGSRRRRLGIDFEPGYTFGSVEMSTADFEASYIKATQWKAVANDGERNFLVVQLGSGLSFFDMSIEPLSTGELPFDIDLEDFMIPTASEVGSEAVQVTSGKGVLFVAGKKITPFYVVYDPDANDITTTQIDIRIRDLVEQDIATPNGEQGTTLTDIRKYDLLNQGWGYIPTYMYNEYVNLISSVNNRTESALDFYFRGEGRYPPKTKPWWVGKRIGDKEHEWFIPFDTYDMIDGGNTLAPFGHFILDPFNKDRATASGIPTLETEVKTTRPQAIAFYAGRVFFGHENTLYFSQVLEDDLNASARCYQDADPTAENVFDLVATDGGTLLIPESGEILAMVPVENSLIVFSDNGVWAVGGSSPGDSFSATGFSCFKISSVGITSARTLVLVEGMPFWWSREGIFHLISDPGKARASFTAENICLQKLQLFYGLIPGISRVYASGAYDKIKKCISWIFNSTDSILHDNRFVCNRILNFDTLLGAFYPYTISDLEENSPIVVDVFSLRDTVRVQVDENVTDRFDAQVTDTSGNTVVSRDTTENSSVSVGLKFVTVVPSEI